MATGISGALCLAAGDLRRCRNHGTTRTIIPVPKGLVGSARGKDKECELA